MKVLAFAASNSRQSINQKLAAYAASMVDNAEVEMLDINDYELPLFSMEREAELGQPELAQQFLDKIGDAEALIISFAEHNGSYTAAYKNLFDWASRIDTRVFQSKSSVFLATSPGGRGGAGVLDAAVRSGPHFGAVIVGSVAVPGFHSVFDVESGVLTDPELNAAVQSAVAKL